MCGIVGMVGLNATISAEVLERATRSLAHRGPDDGGTILLRDSSFLSDSPREPIEVGLGNRRLAILDLSPLGRQPMQDPATGNWIVYNGEIYNFREVRAKLENGSFAFTSHSDTEVILKAYSHWGADCLAEFRGMFAFALWDARKRLLFMARDPMGIKPLYYFQSDKYFLFSSEVRTLLGTGLVPREIDPEGLSGFLSYGSVYEPDTMIRGVKSLAPGYWMTWKDGQLNRECYWDLADVETAQSGEGWTTQARSAAENQIAEMLCESIHMQLVSDVPVGVFLSGGIDSSALVAMLSGEGVRPNTFSIVFREEEYSEAEYSRAVARQFRTDHREITVSQEDFFAAIDPAIHAMDMPTIDGMNTYFVSEKARAAGVKVALSGLGGDEVFAGYSSFQNVPSMERLGGVLKPLPRSVRRLMGESFKAVTVASDQNRKKGQLVSDDAIHPYLLSRTLFTSPQRATLLKNKNGFATVSRTPDLLDENLARARSFDPVNRVSFLEARCYMLNTLLRDSDFMSMAHGLEVRVPLIDHQLARRVLALPGAWKLDPQTPKPLLVGAMRGQLPDKIVHRAKRGFTLPFERWLRGEMRAEMERSLNQIAKGALDDWIDGPAACGVWQDFLAGKTSWSRPWSLYVLQRWCKQHLAS